MSLLFDPVSLGALSLPNRIVMAPMTRCRTDQPGNRPNALMAEYYAQRAGAGLIVTEATQISPEGQGYSWTPGLHSDAQVAGWHGVTDAVHAAGGRIIAQLWHVGRMSHPSFHPDGRPVAPSALDPGAKVWVADPATGTGGMVPCPLPRALDTSEIPRVIEDFARAARNAVEAGFDGVEIHGANGYLIDQFLRASSNHRTDAWGQDRLRFAREVAQAVAAEAGADRTGIRFSPFITTRGMDDPAAPGAILRLAGDLGRLGLAYIHVVEEDSGFAPGLPDTFRQDLRRAFPGGIVVAGGYDRPRAEAVLAAGHADAVAFGRPYLANPDLPRRLRDGLPLARPDWATAFGGGARGYTDYPEWTAA